MLHLSPYSSTPDRLRSDRADAPEKKQEQQTASNEKFWGEDGFTFGDLVDIINPLQHIPIVSTLYQKFTGDEASTGSQIAGGALLGGPIGFVVAMANSVMDQATGKDMGETVVAMFEGDAPSEADTQLAQTNTAPAEQEQEVASAAISAEPKPPAMPATPVEVAAEPPLQPLPLPVASAALTSAPPALPANLPPALPDLGPATANAAVSLAPSFERLTPNHPLLQSKLALQNMLSVPNAAHSPAANSLMDFRL